MHRLKKFFLSFFIFLTAAALFMLSLDVFCAPAFLSGFAAFDAVCVSAFFVSAAAFILIFIIDREKQLFFAYLYTAAIVIGIFLPLFISRIIGSC